MFAQAWAADLTVDGIEHAENYFTIGNGEQLIIKNGGKLTSLFGNIGEGINGGQALITGVGSTWNNSLLYLHSGTIIIENGGQMNSSCSYCADTVDSNGNIVVTGEGSTWNNSNPIILGDRGNFNLTIDDSAEVTTGTIDIGYQGHATVVLANGGKLNVSTIDLANQAGSTGKLIIGGETVAAGAGELTATEINFGSGAANLIFNHTDTDYVFAAKLNGTDRNNHKVQQKSGTTKLTADSSAFDGTTSISGGQLIVSGKLGGKLELEGAGGGGELIIAEGGVVNADSTVIAGGAEKQGRITVTDENSQLNITGALRVADNGTGHLIIENGGLVSVTNGIYLASSASGLASVQVSGAGSYLDGSNDLFVGESGNAELSITDGALVTSRDAIVGNGAGSVGKVYVSGVGSLWGTALNPNRTLIVGQDGEGLLVIENGGYMVTQSAEIGKGVGALGDVLISGEGSILNVNAAGSGDINLGVSGSGKIGVVEGGVVRVGYGDNVIYLAENAGSSAIIFIGADEGEAANAAGRVNAGGLEFGAGSAALIFNHTGDHDFNANLVSSDNGAHEIKQLAGSTTLTGDASDFNGTTIISGGALILNNDLGGSVQLEEGGELTVEDQLTGTIVFNGGKLVVNGTITQNIVVDDGSTIGGRGQFANVQIKEGGVIAPGNSIGTLTVDNIAFDANSIYEVEIDASGKSDQIMATDTATINGGTVKVLAENGNYRPSTQYTILTAANGIAGLGEFADVTSNLAFLDPTLTYDPNHVYLTMNRNDIRFVDVAQTPNQAATAAGAERLGYGHAVYDAVLGLTKVQAKQAFDKLSGELHASVQSAIVEDSYWIRQAANNRLRTLNATANASIADASLRQDKHLWLQALGNWAHQERSSNTAAVSRHGKGLLFGVDAQVGQHSHAGVLLGYVKSELDLDAAMGKADIDHSHFGVYGTTQLGQAASHSILRTGAFFTRSRINGQRQVHFSSLNHLLHNAYHAQTLHAYGELAFPTHVGSLQLEPFANLAYIKLNTNSFTEKGGVSALQAQKQEMNTGYFTLGVRPSAELNMSGLPIHVYGSLAWQHAFNDTSSHSAHRFVGQQDPFSITGASIAQDAVALEAGMKVELSKTSSMTVSYGGRFSDSSKDQNASLTLNWLF